MLQMDYNSFAKAIENRKLNQNIEVIRLAGNFGQHRAILAGLRSTKSPFVAIMDSDLQDRPGDIPVLLQKMLEEDTPMAIARRSKRSDKFLKKMGSKMFAKVSNILVPFKVDPGLGAFRVMDRSIVSQLNSVKESTGTPFSLLYSLNIKIWVF